MIEKIWKTEFELCVLSKVQKVDTQLKLRFSNSLPLHECQLFKFYCDYDVRVLPLSFILTLWASSNNFLQYSKESYPNQLLILLIISFLQNKKVLPTVQKLQECLPEDTKPEIVNGNNVSFCTDPKTVLKLHPNDSADLLKDDSIRAMSTIGLLKDWFQFFATTDLKENAVCSRFGYFIPKKNFQPDSVAELPGDLCRVYRFGMVTGEVKPPEGVVRKKFLISQTPLCVQNPFDLSMNCSRGVTPNDVLKFQTGCKNAAEVLTAVVISDQPDLTEFLAKVFPNVALDDMAGNECKKVMRLFK